jgi:hypothetical protein
VSRVRSVWTEASRMNREVATRCFGGVPLPSGGRAFGPSDRDILQEILELSLDTPPLVVDGSGIARSSIAAAARFWLTPLESGGSLALALSAMRC